jgi:hypothetical protein
MSSTLVYTSDAAHSEARARREAAREVKTLREIDRLTASFRRESDAWGVKLQGWRTVMTARGLAQTLVREPEEVRDYWPSGTA